MRLSAVVVVAAALVAAGTLVAPGADAGAAPARFSVSVPSLKLQRGEFVQRFELTVRKGRVTALPRLPAPWRFKISNERDSAEIEASGQEGSSEFGAQMLQDFVEVTLNQGGTVELRVNTSLDFERIARRLSFTHEELTLRPVRQ